MKYFKILVDSNYIGVGTTADFCRYQKKHNIILICGEKDVQYITHKGILYHDEWMKPLVQSPYEWKQAKVVEIDEEEYLILKNAEDNNEVVPATMMNEKQEVIAEASDNQILSNVRSAKINKLRSDCQNTIVSGFDLELSDGVHHFSMETADQMEISRLVADGDNGEVPYHADGEQFKYYPFSDILKIYNAMNDWKLYNTSYFNDLRSYINSLQSVNQIDSIQYGDEIPEEYQSEVYKDIKDKMDF